MHVQFTLSGLLVQVRLHTTCTASPLPINTLPSRYATSCEITSKTNEISQVLRVHDKDEQHVVFDEGSEESALDTQHTTELTAFFDANKQCKKNDEKLQVFYVNAVIIQNSS